MSRPVVSHSLLRRLSFDDKQSMQLTHRRRINTSKTSNVLRYGDTATSTATLCRLPQLHLYNVATMYTQKWRSRLEFCFQFRYFTALYQVLNPFNMKKDVGTADWCYQVIGTADWCYQVIGTADSCYQVPRV